MQMRPFARDALRGVAGPAHGRNDFTSFLNLAQAQVRCHIAQMGVQSVDGQPIDFMLHDDILAVVGQAGLRVDVYDCPIRRRADRIGRFAAGIALGALDVEALVHLPAPGADAAEGAAWPSAADGRGKIVDLVAGFEYGLVGGREMQRLPKHCDFMAKRDYHQQRQTAGHLF